MNSHLVDTHAHLHHEGLKNRVDQVIKNAQTAGVETIINVGTNEADSTEAVAMADAYNNMYATVGLHPEDAAMANGSTWPATLRQLLTNPKVVGVGECGLDYYRLDQAQPDRSQTSSQDDPEPQEKSLTSDHQIEIKQIQFDVFRTQIELALEFDKPMVWHVRPVALRQAQGVKERVEPVSDAFDDFFSIIDQYPGVRGIVHCFSSTVANMQKAVDRGFLIALNGIMTFSKDDAQLEAARAVPLQNLVLETDCPFLAPVPMRGKPNEPAFVKFTAEFLAKLRGELFEDLSAATSTNATTLFGI